MRIASFIVTLALNQVLRYGGETQGLAKSR